MDTLIAIAIGYLLDLLFGDPHWLPHPVRGIGWLISTGEKIMRKLFPKRELLGGALMAVLVVAVSFAVPFLLLFFVGRWNRWAALALQSFMCYQILATKCLRDESMRVYRYLVKGDLPNARKYLSWIVGRDTQNLNEQQIARAAVETVAENSSDGVIAPMIFMAIGGAPLGFLYKAVNTLDSMVGYKNEKYLLFGRFAAKMDDAANYIPAIFSAWIMMAAAAFLGLDAGNALKIYRRDRHNHASPNSAKTEAVMAGALNLRLAGDAYYFGRLVKKPTIGDDNRPITPEDIPMANRLMYMTSALALLVLEGVRACLVVFL